MVKVYLLIELLRAANAGDVSTKIRSIEFDACKLANVVVLADDKLVAQLDCPSGRDANAAVLTKITPIEGVVQTNVMGAVTPVER
ncbi:hypothetical protein [Hyphomicrobium sulfonivorans]|uniref:hypothetical protein n=1 Tax=Hyphomicrobium sulfonivorans TaxID=121290 RepID=UPI0015704DFA|nr:hypothetical protein [Hyphomicrobium sulfonivorans]MBI1649379.1 hypothetical protein [Hyphomicrobium sulfonivorans]NSL71296.1 hypothetical protein [Hyphomicrobium sulfonivorans]